MSFFGGAIQGFAGEKMAQRKAKKNEGEKKDSPLKRLYKRMTSKKSSVGGQQTQQEAEGKVPEFRRGGKVRKTGLIKAHKGERVLTAKQAKRFKRSSKRR